MYIFLFTGELILLKDIYLECATDQANKQTKKIIDIRHTY